MLQKHGVDTRNVPEIVKVHLHEYYFLTRQANKVVDYLEARHELGWREHITYLGNADADLMWAQKLAPFGVDWHELPDAYKNLLFAYERLQGQALQLYKHYTNGVIDRLTWCAEPIIEEIKKVEQGAA